VSARQIALPPGFDYGFVKRIVRGLVAWRILTATPKGLSFQPNVRVGRPRRANASPSHSICGLTIKSGDWLTLDFRQH